ncbi:sensor histidine kinase [Tessaracoccus coleopterorum]
MLLAAGLLPVTLVLCWVGYLVTGGPEPVVVGLVAFNVAMPAATFVAILRHDLYDVDRAIVLAGVYSILTVGVLVGYATVSAVLGRTLGADSVTAAVVATVVVMLALLPARSFLLRVLGRRLHPRRAAGLDAVAALAERVGAGRDEPERLDEVLREALRDDGLRVGYRRPGATAYLDVAGRPVEEAGGQPIRSGGHDVGVVLPGPRCAVVPSEILTASGLLADQVRLRQELAEALVEVEATRERLLEAGYEERRRLETDLHDGAQQRLVSLGMRLRVAQRHAASGAPVDLDALVDSAVTEIADAVGELRAIAHGLRPSSLDDGLPAALDNLTRSSALPVEVSYSANGIPDHVSLTAYYVASEGVANAVKHAGASRIAIDVRHEDEELRVVVRDDGAGGARLVPGSGLARLRDRVHAHGGSLAVSSPLAQGTAIEAAIPPEHWGTSTSARRADRDRRGLRPVPRGVVGAAGRARARGGRHGRRRAGRASRHPRAPARRRGARRSDAPEPRARRGRGRGRGAPAHPRGGVLLLSQHVETRLSVELVATGRFGYLLKDRVLDVDEFVDALTRVAAGGSALDPEVVARLLAGAATPFPR